MPQMLFPLFPKGATHINSLLEFTVEEGTIYYFNGCMPVFHHDKDDIQSFRMITSQFYINGVVKQSEIVKAFRVTPISVKRAAKTYREEGPSGFYKEQKKGGGSRVLTPDVVLDIENRLEKGEDLKGIAKDGGFKLNTLQKAVRSGHIKKKALS